MVNPTVSGIDFVEQGSNGRETHFPLDALPTAAAALASNSRLNSKVSVSLLRINVAH